MDGFGGGAVKLELPTSRGAWLTSALRPLLAYALWPNLLFWLLGTRLYLMRPAFNIDYLLLGALAPLLPRRLTALLFGSALGLDALVNVAPAFHFQLGRFATELIDVIHLSPLYAIPGALLFMACCAAAAGLGMRLAGPALGRRQLLAGLALATLLTGVDAANGTSLLHAGVTRAFLSFNLANSAGGKTLLALIDAARHRGPGRYTPLPPGGSATAPLLAAARDTTRPLPPWSFAVVTVESMGRFEDPRLAEALLAPLTSEAIRARYHVELGAVPFHGATIDGEFRELCGVRLGSRGSSVPECLPALLGRRGYSTLALHGFTSAFYDRARWYPQLGFEQALFAPELRKRGLSRTCGSGFAGLCDGDVARVLGEELARATPEHPRLIYWMTLNSHIPLADADAQGSSFDCAVSPVTAGDVTLCEEAEVLDKALASVARLALDPHLPATEWVVVGDHAPPFLDRARHEAFAPAEVPFVRLIPRQ